MTFSNHLGLAHFSLEPIAMAYHNWTFQKEETHISKLLKPHMENVIGINHFGRMTLVADHVPLTDAFFPTGILI